MRKRGKTGGERPGVVKKRHKPTEDSLCSGSAARHVPGRKNFAPAPTHSGSPLRPLPLLHSRPCTAHVRINRWEAFSPFDQEYDHNRSSTTSASPANATKPGNKPLTSRVTGSRVRGCVCVDRFTEPIREALSSSDISLLTTSRCRLGHLRRGSRHIRLRPRRVCRTTSNYKRSTAEPSHALDHFSRRRCVRYLWLGLRHHWRTHRSVLCNRSEYPESK